MTEKTKSFLSAAVAWIMAAWVFIFTRDLKSGTDGLIRPEYIPRVVAIILIALGIGLFIQGLRNKTTEEEKQAIREAQEAKKQLPVMERLTPVLTLVLIFLFLFFIKKIGFTTCAVFYLTLQMTLLSGDFSWKSWIKYFIIALIASVLILVIFRYGFKLKLPVNKFKF